MKFHPIAGTRAVKNDQTGMVVRVRHAGAEIDSILVFITGVAPGEMHCSMRLDPLNAVCSAIIQTFSIEMMLRHRGMTNFEQNSTLVFEILEGIREFNRQWPLLPSVRFGTDIDLANEKGIKLSFALPNADYFASMAEAP